jgi:TonB-linked SusC/RagA family outer membrane protein
MNSRIGLRAILSAAAALALCSAGATPAVAQQTGTVQGTVTDAITMRPLSGAQITVTGPTLGTYTNAQGRFTILNVPAGERVIRAQMISYAAQNLTLNVQAGAVTTADFSLSATAVELEGVVVTALGIERQQRAVGVATQQLSDQDLSRVEPNIVNALTGKVSGVHITNAGPQGGSSRIVIRGASSITGNNQPLFVIDGIPIDNSAPRLTGSGGFDFGNAAADIDPENIESITLLKGPNAAALYGSRASNGAVVITTKKGRGAVGGQITVSQVLSTETPLRLPNYQNVYGQGLQGRFEFWDGDGGDITGLDYFDESWGPPMDGRLVPQFHSPVDESGTRRVPLPWVPNPNNVRNFFDRGLTSITSASFLTATETANLRLSLSRLGLEGMVPGHRQERITFGLGGGLQVTDRLRAETTAQYVTSEGRQRPGIGYETSNPMIQFVWWGRQIDTDNLRRNYQLRRPEGDPQAGMPYTWNYRYFPNPYYVQFENQNTDNRDRLIGSLALNYDLAPWLTATLRSGTDLYQDDRRYTYAQDLWGQDGFDPRDAGAWSPVGPNGAFGEWNINFQETNTDFLLSANPQLNLPVSLAATVGATRRDWRRNQRVVYVPDLTAPGIYSVTNARTPVDPWDYRAQRRMNSILGQAEVGYNDHLFLTFTGRNDWSSTLPEDNRSYFYPSVSAAWVFSDVVPALQNTPLEFGKLRASWTRVGADTEPYRLRATFQPTDGFGGFPTFTVPNTLPNLDLRPEQTTSYEVGTELGFFNGRVGLDLTWYTATTRDQIFQAPASRASGYTGLWMNAGSVRNQGIETLLSVVPVQTRDFRWEASANFARNRNTVVALAEGVEGIQLGNFWGVQIWAREGEPYGQIFGSRHLRTGDPVTGDLVVDAFGRLQEGPMDVLGNYTPDWRGGLANTLSYRNLSLNFLIDHQQGGNIFSVTQMFGQFAGVLPETLEGRCRRPAWGTTGTGYNEDGSPASPLPLCNEETGIVVPGVKVVEVVGNDTIFAPNDIWVDAQTYHRGLYFAGREEFILDATYTRLRELTLAFQMPANITNRLGLSGLNVALVGRNLALWSKAKHIDPETAFDASNAQGFEFGQLPTPRSIGIHLNVRP